MLHILNGSHSAAILRRTDILGEIVPWREALAVGPASRGLSDESWIALRAEHLSQAYQKPFGDCKQELMSQEHVLNGFRRNDEVVLWFEHDLFCQANLIYLLARLGQSDRRETKLSLICIDRYPGITSFRGLGQLVPEQFERLFDSRVELTESTLSAGEAAWEAFTAATPNGIEQFIQQEAPPQLPFLADALRSHLARFPSTLNGLGRLQHLLLDLIAGGIDEFKPLFHVAAELEPAYGFGDSQIWNEIIALSRFSNPLVAIRGLAQIDAIPPPADVLENVHFRLTSLGKAVLVGNSDMLNVNRIDYWLGGVHLNEDQPVWRWNAEEGKIIAEE